MNRVKRVVHATAAEVNGLSGKGVTAAVLDTGIALHPDLSDRSNRMTTAGMEPMWQAACVETGNVPTVCMPELRQAAVW